MTPEMTMEALRFALDELMVETAALKMRVAQLETHAAGVNFLSNLTIHSLSGMSANVAAS